MKRFVMIATLLAFVLGMVATASAAELKATGSWKINVGWIDNFDFEDGANGTDSEDDMILQERVRTSFDFIANENLKGVLQIEIGTFQWGLGAGALGGDAIGIEVKSGYVSFVYPNTDISITAGLMPVALPAGPGGNPILDADMTALVVSAPITDNIAVAGVYTRLYADQLVTNNVTVKNADGEANVDNYLDAVALIVPMSFDGVSVTPYAAFVYSGDEFLGDFTSTTDVYTDWQAGFGGLMSQNMTAGDLHTGGSGINITYAGLAFDVSLLDPFNIAGAFHYGAMHGPWDRTDRSGWLGELALTYTGFDFVTPRLYFAYSTGEDGNATDNNNDGSSEGGKSERLPTVRESYNGPDSFFFGSEFLDNASVGGEQQMGFWTVALTLSDISFVEGLTHQVNFIYVEGTNDANVGSVNNGASPLGLGVTYGQTLTEKDSLWEFDLNTKYQIYDELSAVVNMGYINADFDESVWTEIGNNNKEEDAAKVVVGVEYKF